MNPATYITSARPVLALLFAWFFTRAAGAGLYTADKTYLLLSIACAVLIEVSDAIDGAIARKRDQVTQFGKIYDPICDSVARQTIICTFMIANIIPLWMFLVFLYRDAGLSFIRIMCAVDGTIIAAKLSGKLKAVFQAVGIFFVLFIVLCHALNIGSIPHKAWGMHPGFWIMLFPAIFTVLSFFDYYFPCLPVLKKMASKTKKSY